MTKFSNLGVFVIVFGLLSLFYITIFNVFYSKEEVEAFPHLRARFGTILSHSSDINPKIDINSLEEHAYCYYPKSDASFENKAGEYIIKKVVSIEECSSWLGAVIFTEGNWVSEREKLWWSMDMKYQENLASTESESTSN